MMIWIIGIDLVARFGIRRNSVWEKQLEVEAVFIPPLEYRETGYSTGRDTGISVEKNEVGLPGSEAFKVPKLDILLYSV